MGNSIICIKLNQLGKYFDCLESTQGYQYEADPTEKSSQSDFQQASEDKNKKQQKRRLKEQFQNQQSGSNKIQGISKKKNPRKFVKKGGFDSQDVPSIKLKPPASQLNNNNMNLNISEIKQKYSSINPNHNSINDIQFFNQEIQQISQIPKTKQIKLSIFSIDQPQKDNAAINTFSQNKLLLNKNFKNRNELLNVIYNQPKVSNGTGQYIDQDDLPDFQTLQINQQLPTYKNNRLSIKKLSQNDQNNKHSSQN